MLAISALLACGFVLAACGSGSSANTAPTGTTTPAAAASGQRRFGNRTPNPEVQTSIAEGTPAQFAAGRPDIQTSIAEGTPAPFGGG